MPCDSGPSLRDIKRERERIDRLARVACEACGLLERSKRLHELSADAQAWWDVHKKYDDGRLDAELVSLRAKLRMLEVDRNAPDRENRMALLRGQIEEVDFAIRSRMS